MDVEWDTVWAVVVAIVILNAVAFVLAGVGITRSDLPGGSSETNTA